MTNGSPDYFLGEFSLGSDGNFYASATGDNYTLTVFKITPSGAVTAFPAPSSLADYEFIPPPIMGADGNLYGTAFGYPSNNYGAIFKLTPAGQFTILHSFAGGADGAYPAAQLTLGNDGNFYGTTTSGTVFKISPSGDYTVVCSLSSQGVGGSPESPLTLASDGNFYGTTYNGGANNTGTIFQLMPSGTASELFAFPYYSSPESDYGYVGNDQGSFPSGALVEDANGVLYGTAYVGGDADAGTLFAVTVSGLTSANAYKLASVTLSPSSARGTTTTTCTVSFSPAAPPAGATVALSSSSSAAPVPSSVTIPAGSSSYTFSITTGNVTKTTQAVITASYNGMTQSGTLTITPPYTNSVTVNPTSVGGGSATTGTVEISPAAPSGGSVVTLSSSSSLASVPASVTVAAGQKYATFQVATAAVLASAQATITASFNGSVKTTTLTITPAALQSVVTAPSTTTGGATTGGNRVYFDGDVVSDTAVSLSSSDTAIATVASSVTIKAGTSYHSFPITAAKVLTTKAVTITATYNGVSQSATLTVKPDPNAAKSVTLSPSSIVGGQSSTANRVYLNGDATADTTVTLTSSNTAVAVPQSTTAVSSGSSSHVFSIKTSAVTTTQTVTITATADGVSQSATLTVTPPPVAVKSLALSKSSTVAEQSVTGTVTLSSLAPSGGAVVSLSSRSSAAGVPSSVTVAAGATTATFTVTTSDVSSNTTATITASCSGSSQSASLTVTPRTLKSVVLSPTSTQGGTSTTANTVNLYANATASAVITLTSSNPSVAAVPSSVTIAAGSSSHVFTITTSAVSTSQTVAITANYGSVNQTATLTLTP